MEVSTFGNLGTWGLISFRERVTIYSLLALRAIRLTDSCHVAVVKEPWKERVSLWPQEWLVRSFGSQGCHHFHDVLGSNACSTRWTDLRNWAHVDVQAIRCALLGKPWCLLFNSQLLVKTCSCIFGTFFSAARFFYLEIFNSGSWVCEVCVSGERRLVGRCDIPSPSRLR